MDSSGFDAPALALAAAALGVEVVERGVDMMRSL